MALRSAASVITNVAPAYPSPRRPHAPGVALSRKAEAPKRLGVLLWQLRAWFVKAQVVLPQSERLRAVLGAGYFSPTMPPDAGNLRPLCPQMPPAEATD